ncbi:hypothetical protein N7495_004604 [Penicillium taxi]|uniref:uncharacterized protein n=1 Tax=Penicillium taxi TaxID=168475 RepID=UPI002544EEB3|nr:uncharacterized protein N7495_004604 [Penicillium taxi]KAJ5899860.1 hypothetical protein N7495_004604 [Penicillium taxi]
MHSSVIGLSTLVGSVLGSYTLPSGFNVNSVTARQRGMSITKYSGSRYYTTLNFECECFDGTVPDISEYKKSIPSYVCKAAYAQCIASNSGDATA